MHDRVGQYHRADVLNGGIRYQRADGYKPPFVVTTMVTPTGSGDTEPKMAADILDRVHLLWSHALGGDAFDTYHAFTDDDGRTWSNPDVPFPSTKHPDIVANDAHGMLIFAWDPATGHVFGNEILVIGPPPVYAGQWILATGGGSPLVLDDDCFRISRSPTVQTAYMLTGVVGGDTADYVSDGDDCRTWEQIT